MLTTLTDEKKRKCLQNAGLYRATGSPKSSATCFEIGYVDVKSGYRVVKNGSTRRWSAPRVDRKDILRNLSTINRLDREMWERKIAADPNWVNDVPYDAVLQLSDVRPLYHARHSQNSNSRPKALHVIEPQAYDAVTVLDSNSFMFSESNSERRDTDRLQYVGFFFGDEHAATSGSGSDPWFKCNYAFAQFLSRHIRGQRERILADYSVPSRSGGLQTIREAV